MKFFSNLDKGEYEKFLEKYKEKNHFLQSTMWGNLKKTSTLTPHYVGVKKNNEIIACALLLEKQLPFGYSHFYSPRGLVLDYNNFNLLNFFTKELKNYIKKNKGIFLKIDPAIKIENKSSFNNLIKLGYKHKGFNINFENSQPRFSFRIDLNKPSEEVFNCFDRSIKKSISKSVRYATNIYKGEIKDIDKFDYVMKATEQRKDFFSHDDSYYKNFLEVFGKNAGLFIAEININESINKMKLIIEELDTKKSSINGNSKKSENKKKEFENQINDIQSDIDKLKELKEKYPNIVPISGYIISYYSNKAWALYGGNVGDFMFTNINYLLYQYHIEYAIKKGIEIYDLFGSPSPKTNNKQLLGLYEFKKKFGGELVEFIGEFDLIINPFMYFTFTKLIPIYRKIVNKKLKKSIKSGR